MIDRTHVLNASAVLALLHGEAGSEQVRPLLHRSCISSVNWAEVLQKATQHGLDATLTAGHLGRLGLIVVPFSRAEAEGAAALWSRTRHLGLSLGDRACLALAERLNLPAVTAERSWQSVGGNVSVQVIR